MNHTLSESQLEAMIKSAVNSSGLLPPDEKFSQLVSALRELQERRKADSESVAYMHHSGQVITSEECCDDKTFAICCKVETPLYRHAQPAPEKYNIGDTTMRHIFTPTGMTNVSNMQAVFDRVEAVLVGMEQPAPVVPRDVLDALQKVARIRLDLNDFDGDIRGIADCLCDAEEALIVVVNRRAAMLNGGRS